MKKAYKKESTKTIKAGYLSAAPMEEMKARLELNVKDLPQIKDWDVGETYELTLKGKMISKSEGGYSGDQPLRATFEVSKVSNEEDEETDD